MKQAVALLVCRPDGKVLAINRNHKPTGWALIAGKVDDNETLIQALEREVREESGLSLMAAYKIFARIDANFEVHAFQGLITGELKSSDEGDVSWVSMYDLIEGPFGEYNLALFKAVGCEIHCDACDDEGTILIDKDHGYGETWGTCPKCKGMWK